MSIAAKLGTSRGGKSKLLFALLTACVLASAVVLQTILPARATTCVIIHSDGGTYLQPFDQQ